MYSITHAGYYGAVWHTPHHATCHVLFAECDDASSSAFQVLLLLKSSDRVSHDVDLAQQLLASSSGDLAPAGDTATNDSAASAVSLVLRKWYSLRPEREFRCFVHNHDLVGISQRDVTQCYPQLFGDRQQLQEAISKFFDAKIADTFPLPDCKYSV